MTERPLLFSGPMVRAILYGTKTQTRRVVKSRKDPDYGCQMAPSEIAGDEYAARLCPYGQPGDRLWIRESLRPWSKDQELMAYAADDSNVGAWHAMNYPTRCGSQVKKSVPSIHLPRAWSRILLEVVTVRVERLHDISERDAQAEGVIECDGLLDEVRLCARAKQLGIPATECRVWYAELWESINGPGSWEANPWVWVVEFKRIQGESHE